MEKEKPWQIRWVTHIAYGGDARKRDEIEDTNRDQVKSMLIRLNCADFGTFNGRSDHWISFKENILSKAGGCGYSQYL